MPCDPWLKFLRSLLVLILVLGVAAVSFAVLVVLHLSVVLHFHVARFTITAIVFGFAVRFTIFFHLARTFGAT